MVSTKMEKLRGNIVWTPTFCWDLRRDEIGDLRRSIIYCMYIHSIGNETHVWWLDANEQYSVKKPFTTYC